MEPVLSDPIAPFDQAKEVDVIVNYYPEVKVDGFIDGTIWVGLYEKNKYFRLASFVPLSIYTLSCPVNRNESIFNRLFIIQQDHGQGMIGIT